MNHSRFVNIIKRLSEWTLPLVVVALACSVTYSIPWRVQSEEDLPELMGMLDHWNYYLPNAYFMDVSIHSGEFPLWNPLTYCGTPFAANPQAALFYPPNIIRSLLTINPTPLRSHLSLTVMLALHVLLAGTGTYRLARDYKLSHGASFVAVFAFIFSAGFVRRTMANMYITTVAWLPIVLLMLKKSYDAPNLRARIWYALATGLFFGISLLGKIPQMGVYMALTVAVFGVCHRLFSFDRNFLHEYRSLVGKLTLDASIGMMIIASGAFVAAAMLLPGMELASLSERGQQSNSFNHSLAPWAELKRLWKVLVVFTGGNNQWADMRLAGLGATLLALSAILALRTKQILVYTILLIVFIDCAIGPPLPFSSFCLWIAPFRFSSLSRAMMWACFPLAMLAGFGADSVADRLSRGSRSIFPCVLVVSIGGAALGYLLRNTSPHYLLPVGPMTLLSPFFILLIIAFSGFSKPARTISGPMRLRPMFAATRNHGLITLVLAGLLFVELLSWNRHYIPHLIDWNGLHAPVRKLEQPHSIIAQNTRSLVKSPNMNLLEMMPAINGYDPVYIAAVHSVLCSPKKYEKRLLPSDPGVLRNYRSNLFLKRPFWLAKNYVVAPLPREQLLFPSTTVAFLNQALPDSQISEVVRSMLPESGVSADNKIVVDFDKWMVDTNTQLGDGPDYSIRLPQIEIPPLHSVLRIEYRAEGEAAIMATIANSSSTPQQSVRNVHDILRTGVSTGILEIPLPDFRLQEIKLDVKCSDRTKSVKFTRVVVVADRADENQHIEMNRFTANSIDLTINDSAGSRLLVFLDAFYPGWTAYIDGAKTPIFLANDAFKAVEVSPGTHQVQFVFRPWRVYVGMAISVISFVSIIFALVLLRHARSGNS